MNSKHLKLLIAFIALLILANIGIQFWQPSPATPQASKKSRPASPKTHPPAPQANTPPPLSHHILKS